MTESVSCATIGIGAGNNCDGQVLVYTDMLGMDPNFKPKFVRKYADLYNVMTTAIAQYVSDVKSTERN